jgi:hypothetical protein
MLSVIKQNVFVLSVVKLRVVAPKYLHRNKKTELRPFFGEHGDTFYETFFSTINTSTV